jgi:hypothetical protein
MNHGTEGKPVTTSPDSFFLQGRDVKPRPRRRRQVVARCQLQRFGCGAAAMTTAQGRINQGRVDFAALWARDTLFGRRMLTPLGHGSLHEEDEWNDRQGEDSAHPEAIEIGHRARLLTPEVKDKLAGHRVGYRRVATRASFRGVRGHGAVWQHRSAGIPHIGACLTTMNRVGPLGPYTKFKNAP